MEANLNNFLLYTTPNGDVRLDVFVQNENLWLTQKALSVLFDVDRSVITKHITHIFESGELQKKSTCAKFAQVQKEGSREVKREIDYYNLDVIISVGYRVNSSKATQFRIWATQTLKEFIIKGFVINDEKLKQGNATFGKDYFKELLQRIRSIRASERRIYQQITDIFAECCVNYNKNETITKEFYAMIQNKFHFAISGKTAAELIYSKANKDQDHMGLSTWKNSPDGRIIKQDVIVAKNYLQEKEIKQLERTISAYFDYIEGLIERENTFTMEQFTQSVDRFLHFNDYKILDNKGKISKLQANKKAIKEYEIFNKSQKIISDFDKLLINNLNQNKN